MKYDKLQLYANHAADFITILSESGGPSALELYEAMHNALNDEIEWHQDSIDKLRLFKELVSG